MAVDLGALCDDLAAEQSALDDVLEPLSPQEWLTPTPAEGWDVRDSVGHLAHFDAAAALSATDPATFEERELARAIGDSEAYFADILARGRSLPGPEVLAWWRAERGRFADVYRSLDPKQRVPWFGPPMSAASKVTARLMETWAHGQDVVDALGAERPATDRLRHVAHIAVGARAFSYMVRGVAVDERPVRVELTAPSGDTWTWGPADAPDVVRGDALGFCLVLTQRRHRDDADLDAVGPAANEWLDIGQAFAGAPGPGRRPGQFAR